MKQALKTFIVALPLTFGLSGCIVSVDRDGIESHGYSQDWEDREYKNRRQIARLEVGAAYQTVLDKMGDADFSEVYKVDGSRYQVLFYRTHRKHGDGVTTKDECTPVIFKDGVLDSWGEKAYQTL